MVETEVSTEQVNIAKSAEDEAEGAINVHARKVVAATKAKLPSKQEFYSKLGRYLINSHG